MAFASQETVQVLATKEELEALESAYEEDAGNKLSIFGIPILWIESDEEKVLILKQMLIDLRKATFEVSDSLWGLSVGYIERSEGTWRIWKTLQETLFPCKTTWSEWFDKLETLFGSWINSRECGIIGWMRDKG